MPGNTNANRIDVLAGECPVEHALVVSVAILLGSPGSHWPVVGDGVDVLHREVGALNDAHLDAGAAASATRHRPAGQFLQRGEGIRQVGLKHDACFELEQFWLVEELLKDRDREVEVFELFHVEVDELLLRRAQREQVERGEAVDNTVDGLVEGPHGKLGHDRRHLDGDVVNVIPVQERACSGEAVVGLVVTENSFTEEVEVEVHAFATQVHEGLVELRRGGVNDEVADHLA